MRFSSVIAAALALFLLFSPSFLLAQQLPQSPLPGPGAPGVHLQYPRIVLFSTSWCPHCKAAKEYFTRNNIPFINRDVELDPEALELLTGKYRSGAVPLIVIGNDEEVIRGFDEERVQQALERHRKK